MSAEVLKHTLPHTVDGASHLTRVGYGGFPSGHATLAMAFALAWPSVLSASWGRQVRVPLLAWALLTAVATVPAGWHRPGEAAAGMVLAVIWHLALQPRRSLLRPSRRTPSLRPHREALLPRCVPSTLRGGDGGAASGGCPSSAPHGTRQRLVRDLAKGRRRRLGRATARLDGQTVPPAPS
ncbi:phosphatase PAP2 family protein [Phycicoccus mangrovi]|uniref:phosphatase PAP2 family protein n=1 Tax=Phycicoccus mangrovi TaxID=2840470 RepID=UPI003556CF55